MSILNTYTEWKRVLHVNYKHAKPMNDRFSFPPCSQPLHREFRASESWSSSVCRHHFLYNCL